MSMSHKTTLCGPNCWSSNPDIVYIPPTTVNNSISHAESLQSLYMLILTKGESLGPYLATGMPFLSITNLVKFHLTKLQKTKIFMKTCQNINWLVFLPFINLFRFNY